MDNSSQTTTFSFANAPKALSTNKIIFRITADGDENKLEITKPTICEVKVLAIETTNNFTGKPLVTKAGKPFVNIKMKARDGSNRQLIVYDTLYSNNLQKARAIAEVFLFTTPDFNEFDVGTLVGLYGHAELDSQSYTSKDGTIRNRVIVKRWNLGAEEISGAKLNYLKEHEEHLF